MQGLDLTGTEPGQHYRLEAKQHGAQLRTRALHTACNQRKPAMVAGENFQQAAGLAVRILVQYEGGLGIDAPGLALAHRAGTTYS